MHGTKGALTKDWTIMLMKIGLLQNYTVYRSWDNGSIQHYYIVIGYQLTKHSDVIHCLQVKAYSIEQNWNSEWTDHENIPK